MGIEPFLGDIMMVSFNFAPKGWAMCNGQFLPINQNQALFALLGTTFGGNGQTTFALPDLRGRVPVHTGDGLTLGQRGGEEAHTITIQEMPTHLHLLNGSKNNATQPGANPNASSNAFARSGQQMYGNAVNLTTMHANMVGSVGGSQPHVNRQPFLTLTFCIALQGVFPSRN
jgi:microcystin-dependent protein